MPPPSRGLSGEVPRQTIKELGKKEESFTDRTLNTLDFKDLESLINSIPDFRPDLRLSEIANDFDCDLVEQSSNFHELSTGYENQLDWFLKK